MGQLGRGRGYLLGGRKLVRRVRRTGIPYEPRPRECRRQAASKIAPLHWANETLECYGLTKCSDLPAAKDTAMGAIEIRIGTAHPTLKWTPVNAVTTCGQHTVVASNANPNGSVDLFYN